MNSVDLFVSNQSNLVPHPDYLHGLQTLAIQIAKATSFNEALQFYISEFKRRKSEEKYIILEGIKILSSRITNACAKYKSVYDFKEEYTRVYVGGEMEVWENHELVITLMQTANWMHLYKSVRRHKVKGLLMWLVPMLVEGTDGKYITGGAQSLETTLRTRIFEHEFDSPPRPRAPKRKLDNYLSDNNNVKRERDMSCIFNSSTDGEEYSSEEDISEIFDYELEAFNLLLFSSAIKSFDQISDNEYNWNSGEEEL